MITGSIANAFDRLETVSIPGPWPGASGESWEIAIGSLRGAGFSEALEAAGIRPRSLFDRANVDPVEADKDAAKEIFKRVRKAKGKAALAKLQKEAEALDAVAAEATKAAKAQADVDREGIVKIGYDLEKYPEDILSLSEVEQVCDAVALHLVIKITEIDAGGDRREWEPAEVAEVFASDDIVPNVIELPLPADAKPEDEPEYEALYLRGEKIRVALAAWVIRHAAQDFRFLERRGPLASASGLLRPKRSTGAGKKASGKSKPPA